MGGTELSDAPAQTDTGSSVKRLPSATMRGRHPLAVPAVLEVLFMTLAVITAATFIGLASSLNIRTGSCPSASTDQAEVRRLFREYLDQRIRISESTDEAQAVSQLPEAAHLRHAIWAHAISATKQNVQGAALTKLKDSIR